MRRLPILLALAAGAIVLAAWVAPVGFFAGAGAPGAAPREAPDFPSRAAADWINSEPLTMAGLRGQVVLLDVFTFG